jgi:tetratricopeptide (TPR) repeat protein
VNLHTSFATPAARVRPPGRWLAASVVALLALQWPPHAIAQSAAVASPGPGVTQPTTPPAAVPVSSASVTDAYAEFRRRFDAGQYVEAVDHARSVAELTEGQATDPTAEDVQVALMNLGMVQNLAADYSGAEATFQRVIGLIEKSGRPTRARLVRAYAGLASAYHDGKRHELAVQAFDQAIALTRRHEGLLTEQQVPLIEKYIDSLTELGRYPEALQAQKYLLRIATRQYGATSVEIVPRLEQIGRWYASVGAYDQSRRILKQALGIIATAEGEQSQRLVGPLLALAACNRRQLLDPVQQQQDSADNAANRFNDPTAPVSVSGYSPGMLVAEGERALLQAAALTDAAPEPPPMQVLNVRTQLGDWYQLRQQPDRALPHYRQAWLAATRISEKLEGKAYTEAIFGKPVLLHVVRPEGWNRYAGRAPDTVEARTVVVEFAVDPTGRVHDGKIVDDSGDTKRAEKTVRALAETGRYRPRFEAGEPVVTPEMRFEQPWILPLPEPTPAAPGNRS